MPDLEHEHSPTVPGNHGLDEALEDTFPASDPPAMTSPLAATPTASELQYGGADGEIRVYRVIEMSRAADPFGAEGNADGGRWTSPGTPCVYTARSPAGALLEFLVHRDGVAPPDGQLAMAVGVIPSSSVLVQSNEPSGWRECPYRGEVQQVGDAWAREQHSHALAVPSAICPDEWNILLNPGHEAHAALRLLRLQPLVLDPRLVS